MIKRLFLFYRLIHFFNNMYEISFEIKKANNIYDYITEDERLENKDA